MLYNSDVWSADSGTFSFPKDRFLEYTEDSLIDKFKELTPQTIRALKEIPTLFTTEHEEGNTRVGKITDIKVNGVNLDIQYEFDGNYFPLIKGALDKYRTELGIDRHILELDRTYWAIKEADIPSFYEKYLTSLPGVAQKLQASDKKIQLIYAFNGTGKTRLSREFKKLVDLEDTGIDEESPEKTLVNILYYNAYTEDLFYWDNDIDNPKMNIHSNTYTDWIIRDRGQDQNITEHFQRYTSNKLTPYFEESEKQQYQKDKLVKIKTYPSVSFVFGGHSSDSVKVSKGEESNFIWSVFWALLKEATEILQEPVPAKRDDDIFDNLQYVFIDDPVSSLDDNHLIELAVDLAELIKSNQSDLKFIITTHNPLFYNVLSNEFNNKYYKDPEAETRKCIYKPKQSQRYRLDKNTYGTFVLDQLGNNTPFSYHLFLLSEIKKAIVDDDIKKFHFGFLRNILEKTATFLGYTSWPKLLPKGNDGNPDPFANRILNLSNHSAHSGEEVAEIQENDKVKLIELVKYLSTEYKFWKQEV